MTMVYGARDIARNPSLLRIDGDDSFVVEDKKAHKKLGVYIGVELANEFFEYLNKQKLLSSAYKIKTHSIKELELLDGSSDDGL